MAEHTLHLSDMELEAVINALSGELESAKERGQQEPVTLAAFAKAYALSKQVTTLFVPTTTTVEWAKNLPKDDTPTAA